MSNIDTNGKRLNLFPMKKKKVSSNQAFDMMESVADKSSVNLLKTGEIDKSTKGIHNALMAAGMTPAYGNVADLADATLYALEGEFGDAAWSAAAAIPIIGQMVAGKRALKIAKESGEEIVKLYRGVPDWYQGKMVKKGKFVGVGKYLKQEKLKAVTKVPKSLKGWANIDVVGVGEINQAKKNWENLPLVKDFSKESLWVTESFDYAKRFASTGPKGIVLEFEVPSKLLNKIGFLQTGRYKKDIIGIFNKGLDKRFLKKVHK
jgi:hypothetical protein